MENIDEHPPTVSVTTLILALPILFLKRIYSRPQNLKVQLVRATNHDPVMIMIKSSHHPILVGCRAGPYGFQPNDMTSKLDR